MGRMNRSPIAATGTLGGAILLFSAVAALAANRFADTPQARPSRALADAGRDRTVRPRRLVGHPALVERAGLWRAHAHLQRAGVRASSSQTWRSRPR